MIYYLNGHFIPQEKAKISVRDIGLLRSYGVFDFLRTYNHQPFLWLEHFQRLKKSASAIGLKLPFNQKEFHSLLIQLIDKNHQSEIAIRTLITGGVGLNSVTPAKTPTVCLMAEPIIVYPRKYYTQGAKVITLDHLREFPQAKTLNYTLAIYAQSQAKNQAAPEALYVSDKHILEGTTSNFFAVKNNLLLTPKNNILLGITRNFVIQLARDSHIKVLEADIKLSQIPQFQEAFITSTSKEIMPIIKINNQSIGSDKIGPVTKKLMTIFHQKTNNYVS